MSQYGRSRSMTKRGKAFVRISAICWFVWRYLIDTTSIGQVFYMMCFDFNMLVAL